MDGTDVVACHHSSLSKERRLDAEERLKAGSLRALVATASLELGIDVGDVDLVVQLGVTRSIAAFLQRVGRAGHGVGRLPVRRDAAGSGAELTVAAADPLNLRGILTPDERVSAASRASVTVVGPSVNTET